MHEELAKYEGATSNEDSVEELADLLEIIYVVATVYDITMEEFEMIPLDKAKKRGRFYDRIFF